MELKLIDTINEINIFSILDKGVEVGSVELIFNECENYIYIENICRLTKFKNNKYLSKVIKYLKDTYNTEIRCLPLQKYRTYYESLGFVPYEQTNEDDIYYKLI